ncbi:MAG: hypothetical protein ABH879_11055 [archaeon]
MIAEQAVISYRRTYQDGRMDTVHIYADGRVEATVITEDDYWEGQGTTEGVDHLAEALRKDSAGLPRVDRSTPDCDILEIAVLQGEQVKAEWLYNPLTNPTPDGMSQYFVQLDTMHRKTDKRLIPSKLNI